MIALDLNWEVTKQSSAYKVSLFCVMLGIMANGSLGINEAYITGYLGPKTLPRETQLEQSKMLLLMRRVRYESIIDTKSLTE